MHASTSCGQWLRRRGNRAGLRSAQCPMPSARRSSSTQARRCSTASSPRVTRLMTPVSTTIRPRTIPPSMETCKDRKTGETALCPGFGQGFLFVGRLLMRVGTKSVLFGYHSWWLHPFLVAEAWRRLYGFPWDPRLWVAFFVHDLGYFGMPNMDGVEGKQHPFFGAAIMHFLFDVKP